MTGLGSQFAQSALSGPLLVALTVAGVAGLVSFASPCVLPLVPGYLSYVTGLSSVALEDRRRWRVVLGAGLFVLGFAVVFIGLGAAFGALGEQLQRHQVQLSRWLGGVVVLMGLVFLGVLPGSGRQVSLRWRPAAGLAGAPLLGVVFRLGWAPCIGPTLSAVLSLATDQASAWRGAVLTAAYCAGLGVPFLVVALFVGRSQRLLMVLRRHRLLISRVGGVGLVVIGVLLLTGLWGRWLAEMQGVIGGFQTVV